MTCFHYFYNQLPKWVPQVTKHPVHTRKLLNIRGNFSLRPFLFYNVANFGFALTEWFLIFLYQVEQFYGKERQTLVRYSLWNERNPVIDVSWPQCREGTCLLYFNWIIPIVRTFRGYFFSFFVLRIVENGTSESGT